MDLGLYLRVLWRFRLLVAIGILLSAGLGILSQARVELDGGIPQLSYRTPLTWASTSTVLITEKGFPWGASSLQDLEALQRGERPRGPQYTDPGRFTQLGLLYARLAKSDDVRAALGTSPVGAVSAADASCSCAAAGRDVQSESVITAAKPATDLGSMRTMTSAFPAGWPCRHAPAVFS